MSNGKYKWIGTRPDRPDGADKVTGRYLIVTLVLTRNKK